MIRRHALTPCRLYNNVWCFTLLKLEEERAKALLDQAYDEIKLAALAANKN